MDSSPKVNWQTEESAVLLNPRLLKAESDELQKLVQIFPREGHIWIASSGSSTGAQESVKLIALSKKAFIASAMAVNSHLQSTPKDLWVQVLPRFHVGGLAIEARAEMSGSQIISGLHNEKWDPAYFHQVIEKTGGSLSALVPTQVYDLVQAKLKSPKSLRAIVIGGSALSSDLYEQAVALGWPLLPSYGMTECCSQVATAKLDSWESRDQSLHLLTHIKARVSTEGFLEIQSPSLLTGYAQLKNGKSVWVDPKVEGWFQAQDLCEIRDGILVPLGRSSDFVKIKGEGVNLQKLQEVLEKSAQEILSHFWQEVALVALKDERSQNKIVLAATEKILEADLEALVNSFNQKVAPFEKIQNWQRVSQIPRTDLGKIAREKLKSLL